MTQIALNANSVWNKHVFVKFGEVNRIPVQSDSGLSTPIAEGSIVQMTGDYTITNALTVNNPVYGMALMNDPAAQYQDGVQYPLSVLPVTLGAVISIPVDVFHFPARRPNTKHFWVLSGISTVKSSVMDWPFLGKRTA